MIPKPLCSHRECKRESVATTTDGDPVCFDHLTDFQIEKDLFDDKDERGRSQRVLRHGRAW
jgi:hypothetical protein